jgi:hypothetical protein
LGGRYDFSWVQTGDAALIVPMVVAAWSLDGDLLCEVRPLRRLADFRPLLR